MGISIVYYSALVVLQLLSFRPTNFLFKGGTSSPTPLHGLQGNSLEFARGLSFTNAMVDKTNVCILAPLVQHLLLHIIIYSQYGLFVSVTHAAVFLYRIWKFWW